MLTLKYMDFEWQDDWSDLRSWNALASPAPHHNAAMLAELQALLTYLEQKLGPSGPMDDGYAWDQDVQLHLDNGQSLTLGAVAATAVPSTALTLSLHLCGREALTSALGVCLPKD